MLEPSEQNAFVNEMAPSLVATCDFEIDRFLLSALNTPRDRLFILKLDQELEKFIKDMRRVRYDFPPMSSYQRLIVHRMAQYFKLEHSVMELDAVKRAVILTKTSESKIPVLRFTDLVEQQEQVDTPKAVKIMRRQTPDRSGRSDSSSKTGNSSGSSSKDKTLEEREEDYAKARARIFGAESKGEQTISKENEEPTSSTSVTAPSATTSPKEDREQLNGLLKPKQNPPFLTKRVSNENESSPEFSRGEAEMANANNNWAWNRSNVNSFDASVGYNGYESQDPAYVRGFSNGHGFPPNPVPWYPVYSYQPNGTPLVPEGYVPSPNPMVSYPMVPLSRQNKSPPNVHKPNEKRTSFDPRQLPSHGATPLLQPYQRPMQFRNFQGHVSEETTPPTWPYFPGTGVYPTGPGVHIPVQAFVPPSLAPVTVDPHSYDRRPPKSAELFDPNNPYQRSPMSLSGPIHRPISNLLEERQNAFPRSPSHDSFFTVLPTTPTVGGNSGQSDPQGDAMKSVPTQLDHILEIIPLPNTKLSDASLIELRQCGATIKFLGENSAIAVFKNSKQSNQALSSIKSSAIQLRHWKLPLAPVPSPNDNQQAPQSPQLALYFQNMTLYSPPQQVNTKLGEKEPSDEKLNNHQSEETKQQQR